MPASLVDVLRWRAKNQPHQLAYRFLADGENDEVVLTYAALDRHARAIGALLQSAAKAGDRALLLFPPGLDFIKAYFGCLYAKIIAIPSFPPHAARIDTTISITLNIAADARPAVVLLTSSLFDAIDSHNTVSAKFGNIKLLATDKAELAAGVEEWQAPEIVENDIAFLQYTSGSTIAPRGVIVSHSNLLHNLRLMERCFGLSGDSSCVIWLPHYHDMGLIGGILQPLYSGIAVTLIPHMMFLQHPFRWLQAISRFRATVSGGPNFAYDLCVRKIKPEQREQLDLSLWKVAFNGAEPVYHKTLDDFATYFSPCGFRREAFLPCYGLAEATLFVTGGPKYGLPKQQNLINTELERNQVVIASAGMEDTRTIVSCGKNMAEDQEVAIVNPDTLTRCPVGEIGEIWVRGSGVTNGYWNKPEETGFAFGARLCGSEEKVYLRTGDLGFLYDGELYITGRIKNLIISGGKNHYPHDIERTIEKAHTAICPAGCAVFSISHNETERVIAVAEVKYKLFTTAKEEVVKAIRRAVSESHGLCVDDICLTNPGSIPRTTSGKIRHFLCRKYYLEGTLKQTISI